MNKSRLYTLAILGAFVVAVILFMVAMATESLNFPAQMVIAVPLLLGGVLYTVQGVQTKKQMGFIIGAACLVAGLIITGVTYYPNLWWLILTSCVLAVAIIIGVRLMFNVPKWDAGDNQKKNDNPFKQE